MTRKKRSRQKPEKREGDSPPEPRFPIVGIGASAGGLKALQLLFDAIGEEPGMAFVVVLHLAPDLESNLAEVLQKHTMMPVIQITRKTEIQPDHVYVIPPNRSLDVADNYLLVSEFTSTLERRKPIDHFFRSLAAVAHDVIGIILSGSGTDGTVGIKAINENGGIVIVQSPSEAEHDSMPRSAIATHLVDRILPVKQIAETLIEYKEIKKQIRLPSLTEDLHEDENHTLQKIFTLLRSKTGNDFSQYKRSTVLRRIGRRMQVYHLTTIEDYLDYVSANDEEATALLQELLISVTSFFRDPASWQTLQKEILPRLFENKGRPDQIRAWVAGCATGEEAYSLAMLLLELAEDLDDAPEIQVFATDIDETALRFARAGRYPGAIEADVNNRRLKRFFHKKGLYYQVREEVREHILFTPHNLLKDPPFSQIDLITCRNLLIYFNRDLQQSACDIFHYALRQNGFLFLGSAEGIEEGHKLFEPISTKHSIFQSVKTRKTPLPSVIFSVHQQQTDFAKVREETSKNRRAPDLMRQYHGETLEKYAPPSLLIDRNNDILHISDTAGRFLVPPTGVPTANVIKLVREELRVDLQTALYRAFEHQTATSSQPIRVHFDGLDSIVHLIVLPSDEKEPPSVALVLFVEVEESAVNKLAARTQNPTTRELQLLDQLQKTREQLLAMIEESESFKEEMMASNEELQSLNEEYKSATEELETGKEELQSLNEELQTTNEELKNKVEELSQANSHLKNLMASTEIGTLFLDRELRQTLHPGSAEPFQHIGWRSGTPNSAPDS